MAFNIIAVTTGIGGSFTIGGEQKVKYPDNIEFRVFGSTGNDDRYVVQSTALVLGTTVSGFQVVNLGDNALNGFHEVDVGGVPGGKEITDITTVADVGGSLGATHYLLDSPTTQYYVWYDVDNGSIDPAPAGRIPIEVNISANNSAIIVAAATSAVIGTLPDFNVGLAGSTITVTNNVAGNVIDAVDVDTGFTITVTTQGVGVVNTTPTGLANDATVYTAIVKVDGGSAQPVAITGNTAQTYLDLITEINTDLTADAVASIVNGNVRVTSIITGDESAVLITDVPLDLFGSLTAFSTFNAPVPGGVTLSGFQVVDVGGGIGNKNSTGFPDDGVVEVTDITTVADVGGNLNNTFFNLDTPGTDYYVWYNVGFGGVDPNPGGRAGIEVNISTNDTDVVVANATRAKIDAETDFISTSSLNVVTVTNVVKGTVPDVIDGAAPTGFGFAVTQQGSDGTVFTANITIDGVAQPLISILSSNAQNYFQLLNEINADLSGATAVLVDGNVRITSVTTGTISTVSITDVDLFSSLTDFIEILTAVIVTPTGLANDATVYTASVSIDGGGPQPIDVTGSTAQNYSDLLTEINTDIAGAMATVDSTRNVRITSTIFSPTSTVSITDTDLFSSLDLFQAINTVIPGEDDTVITVFSNIPDGTVDGQVFLPGSYLLDFTDNINPSFMLEPQVIDGPPGTTTSLSLIGRGTLDYGESINENFLALLENFASGGTEPTDPVIGQLWYDDSVNLLKVYNGIIFNPLATGSTIVVTDENVVVGGGPHTTLNFTGPGVIATNAGGGVVDVLIAGSTGIADVDTDTQIRAEANPDEDILRFDTGDTPIGYSAVPNIMILASNEWTVNLGNASVPTTPGAPINITAGAGNTTGAGGDITLVPGTGGVGGEDGAVILNTTNLREFTTETVSAGVTVIGSIDVVTNTSIMFEVTGIGRETGGATIVKKIFGSIERTGVAANTIIVGSTVEDRTDKGNGANWDITVSADTINGKLDVNVDDGSTETVEWKVLIKFFDVTQP